MAGEGHGGPQGPDDATELEDIGIIFGYLGLHASSPTAQRILGLSRPEISNVLTGRGVVDQDTRRHIAQVAAVIERLADARSASTGSRDRGTPAGKWLELAEVTTSQGFKSPIEILADDVLCLEVLDALIS